MNSKNLKIGFIVANDSGFIFFMSHNLKEDVFEVMKIRGRLGETEAKNSFTEF